MRFSAASRTLAFLFVLLVISLVSSGIPIVYSQARVGEIVLTPTHAVPGTLVSFEGDGWNLQGYEMDSDGHPVKVTCQVSGEPVKKPLDLRYYGCELGAGLGRGLNPVGSFVVANVTAGTYKIYITIEMMHWRPKISKDFTVDAAQPIPEFPLPVLVLLSSLIVTYMISTRRKRKAPS